MVFKLPEEAQKGWRKLRGYKMILHVINGKNLKVVDLS